MKLQSSYRQALCYCLFLLLPWGAAWPAGTTADDTLLTLGNLLQLRQTLQQDISELNKQAGKSTVDSEKKELKSRIAKLEQDQRTISRNFEEIAAGSDISSLQAEKEEKFNFQREMLALLRPAMEEMKAVTAQFRKKAGLRERVAHYGEQMPVLERAKANAAALLGQTEDPGLLAALREVEAGWGKQYALMQGELQSSQLQLDLMLKQEVSLTEASQSYLKSFFQKRGFYLLEALLVVVAIALLSRLNHYLLRRFAPGFRCVHRSFRVRLVELFHYLGTLLLMVLGPMLVFYLEEDWVLLSLGILLLIGMVLTLRHALPRYIHQIQLFLNIGTVREGERILLDGLPWKVSRMNVYCSLVNPDANLTQRLHIDMLVGMRSRPCNPDEPWFPCRVGEWVILADGVRARVTGITEELVGLSERGGARLTYRTGDFLAASPRNLSAGFRIKEVIGISYALQDASTGDIPERFAGYVRQRLQQEGYGEQLLDFKVEFTQAGSSSLDLVLIADFSGEMGELYGRLRRVLQRLAVDACSHFDWDIPFPQMTLHGMSGTVIPAPITTASSGLVRKDQVVP